MGLMIHSLEELPAEATRGYYIYVLDYGWDEPLSNALRSNFGEMGKQASQNNAIVFRGTVGSHFEDEVLSWHSVNGQKSDGILPAILITTKHPNSFRGLSRDGGENVDDNLILIPLKKHCKTSLEVVELIENIFLDIREGRELKNFRIGKEIKKGVSGAIVDAIILEPNFSGIGIKLKPLLSRMFKGKK
jgi:hypothetical protein